jgi:hypothetical protein
MMCASQSQSPQLLLLTTQQQVHAFDLSHTFRVALGRHESSDLKLPSRTVSNFHAEILMEGESLELRDLGSTNGTYVNDEAVRQRYLKCGDRICIGNYVVTVHLKQMKKGKEAFYQYKRNPDAFGIGICGNIFSLRAKSGQAAKTLRVKDPRDLTLPDLLKILTTNAFSVMIHLKKGTQESRIFVKKDRIVHAEYGQAQAEKALFRLFGWPEATYEIKEYPATPSVPHSIHLPTDALIMEGMKEADEMDALVRQLPALVAPLQVKEDCPLPLSAHTSGEIEIYLSIIRHQRLVSVLEESQMTDVKILRLADALIRKGVFGIRGSADTLLEPTSSFRREDLSG